MRKYVWNVLVRHYDGYTKHTRLYIDRAYGTYEAALARAVMLRLDGNPMPLIKRRRINRGRAR